MTELRRHAYEKHHKVLTDFFNEHGVEAPEFVADVLIEFGKTPPMYNALRYVTRVVPGALPKKRQRLEVHVGEHPEDRWVESSRGRLDPEDKRHGTIGGYTNHGCRGPKCTKAMSEHNKAERAQRKKASTKVELIEAEVDKHGTVDHYLDGCRDPRCKAAARELVILGSRK